MTAQELQKMLPVKIMRVEDWISIARLKYSKLNTEKVNETAYVSIQALSRAQRYEELTQGGFVEVSICNKCQTKHSPPKGNNGCCSGATSRIEKVFQPALLKKSDFVNEVEKPVAIAETCQESVKYFHKKRAYQSAQSALVFEGFEWKSDTQLAVDNLKLSPYFSIVFGEYAHITNEGKTIFYPTIFDLIIEVDRYNRKTATTKIELTFTEAFCKKIIS